jgi:diguanylate cyclase (GGDEF)-like protein
MAGETRVGADWVVVLEATADDGSVLSVDAVRTLMESMADHNPTTLYTPDRYALQIVVPARTADQALTRALSAWQSALRRLQMRAWHLTRAEVICRAEFERDIDLRAREVAATRPNEVNDLEEDLLRQAFHDSVTGLAGRALFMSHLGSELRRAERTSGSLGLVLLEVCLAGAERDSEDEWRDAALRAFADRLTHIARSRDCAARVGDSCFAVLLHEVSEDAAQDVAARLASALRAPVVVAGRQIAPAVRIGVTASRRGETPESLFLDAETALRQRGVDLPLPRPSATGRSAAQTGASS